MAGTKRETLSLDEADVSRFVRQMDGEPESEGLAIPDDAALLSNPQPSRSESIQIPEEALSLDEQSLSAPPPPAAPDSPIQPMPPVEDMGPPAVAQAPSAPPVATEPPAEPILPPSAPGGTADPTPVSELPAGLAPPKLGLAPPKPGLAPPKPGPAAPIPDAAPTLPAAPIAMASSDNAESRRDTEAIEPDDTTPHHALRPAVRAIREFRIKEARDFLRLHRQQHRNDDMALQLVQLIDVAESKGLHDSYDFLWQRVESLLPALAMSIANKVPKVPGLGGSGGERDPWQRMSPPSRHSSRWTLAILSLLALALAVVVFWGYPFNATDVQVMQLGDAIPGQASYRAEAVLHRGEHVVSAHHQGYLGALLVGPKGFVEEGGLIGRLSVPPRVERILRKREMAYRRAHRTMSLTRAQLTEFDTIRASILDSRSKISAKLERLAAPQKVKRRPRQARQKLKRLRRARAKANRELSRLTRQQKVLKKRLRTSTRKVKALEAKLKTFYAQRGVRTLRAPTTGRIFKLHARRGEPLKVKQPVATLRSSEMMARFSIPSNLGLEVGSTIVMTIAHPAAPEEARGRVVALDPKEKGFQLDVSFSPNTKTAPGQLKSKPQLLRLPLESAQQLRVPAAALVKRDDGTVLYTVRERRIYAHAVHPLAKEGRYWVVAADPLGPQRGEALVVALGNGDPLPQLKHGQDVDAHPVQGE